MVSGDVQLPRSSNLLAVRTRWAGILRKDEGGCVPRSFIVITMTRRRGRRRTAK